MNCRIQKQISTIPRSNQRSLKLSLDFAIAAALGRYPMATLRGSFAKVVVVDQPLCQELREICNSSTAFDRVLHNFFEKEQRTSIDKW